MYNVNIYSVPQTSTLVPKDHILKLNRKKMFLVFFKLCGKKNGELLYDK